ncbi:transglutaminase family protein [Arthrobacter deserti]|uniref:Transglutaminase family protein n=1 Tax=Arthrobacter deserti TaxID=1742687 RepID=A0ABX1JKA7_9MICC|nr:transglutaminase family protein [Arthrobacter deserti]
MRRAVSARIAAKTTANTSMVFAVAAVRNPGFETFEEQPTVLVNSEPARVGEVEDVHGSRLHLLEVAEPSTVELDYSATVTGRAVPEAVDEVDQIKYVRPSRYCESDHLLPTSYAEFGSLEGAGLLAAVRDWVGRELSYVGGSSRSTDGAVQTLLARRGVCRDYSHLVVSLLRAKDVPARLAAVYAPGPTPMDFHAVAEAYVDAAWHVVDATGLATRHSLLRISTGRDASDTAFLSTVGGSLSLQELKVTAEIDEPVPDAGPAALVQLG